MQPPLDPRGVPVALRRVSPETLKEELHTVLDLSGCLARFRAGSEVLIKPNLVTDKPEYIALGANTSVEVLAALLEILRDHDCRVAIGESDTGTAVKGRRLAITWRLMGLDVLAERFGARLLNFSELPRRMGALHSRFLSEVELPEAAFECDLLIDIPKIKTHKYAVLTCAMKNLFGLLPEPRRIVYHRNLHRIIAELALLLSPKTVVLVDGLVGMEGNGPLYGKPVNLNLLLASQDLYSVDRAVCELIGASPRQVKYLCLAERLGVGIATTPSLVVGESLEACRRPFEPVAFNPYRWFEKKLMESPLVHVVTSEWFQRHVSSHIAGLT
ncbi:MAG: DUF362 domain-containing protein, partial [Candidatus Omnitrophica bacterium]|nr:DUF362 domain-containing protein [Candidatus Omnitrophota bacterium]